MSRVIAVIALLSLLLTGCVSREDSSGTQKAPETVPLSELSDVTLQVEYYNGLVYSAARGTGTGDEKSDTHEVAMTVVFRIIDEMLPEGTLEPNAEELAATFPVPYVPPGNV